MQSPAFNLALAATMLAELEDYLRSGEVFWPLSRTQGPGGVHFPRLTLGGLLLTLDELQAQAGQLAPAEATAYRKVRAEYEVARLKHQANLTRKALEEAKVRLNQWRAYLDELEEGATGGDFAQQVRNRLIVDRLADEFGESAAEMEKLRSSQANLDRRLNASFSSGAFALNPRLKSLYDRERHWYLYGAPRP